MLLAVFGPIAAPSVIEVRFLCIVGVELVQEHCIFGRCLPDVGNVLTRSADETRPILLETQLGSN
jgi:hypothetical protein